MKQKKPTEIYSKKTGLLSKYYGLSESDKEYLNNFENFTQGNADLGKSSDFFEKNSGYSSLASYRKDIDSMIFLYLPSDLPILSLYSPSFYSPSDLPLLTHYCPSNLPVLSL